MAHVLRTAQETLTAIAEQLNGTIWNADTIDAIAELVRQAGFTIRDVEAGDYEDNARDWAVETHGGDE